MRKIIVVCSVFLCLSCVKKKKQSEVATKDSIQEITIAKDTLPTCGVETLFNEIERTKNNLEEQVKEVKESKVLDSLLMASTKQIVQTLDSVNQLNNTSRIQAKYHHESQNYSYRIEQLSLELEKNEKGTYVLLPVSFFKDILGDKKFRKYDEFYQLVFETQKLNSQKYDHFSYRKNCLDWEKYIQSVQNEFLKEEAKTYYKIQVKKFLFGTEEEKTFDPSAKKFNENIEENFIYIVKKYPNTVTAELTKKFMKYFYEYTDKSETKSFYKSLHNSTMENIDKAFSE